MDQTLEGRSALVTGSTSGIGLGIARGFAAAGAKVMLNGFGKPEEIEARAPSVGKLWRCRAPYSAADMSKPHQIAEMVAGTLRALQLGCDILVNNAGIQHVAPLEEFPAEKWDAIIAINLASAFHTIAAAYCRR